MRRYVMHISINSIRNNVSMSVIKNITTMLILGIIRDKFKALPKKKMNKDIMLIVFNVFVKSIATGEFRM